MSVIKEAFTEGRETDTDWEASKAKRNQVKMENALENISMMKKREFHSAIPLEQICPDTGKVLNFFPTRMDAARWIVANVLDNKNKNPLSITGNMEMCMRSGWKAYGYFWRLSTAEKSLKYAKTNPAAKEVFVRHGMASAVYPSIAEAARVIGVSPKSLAARLDNNAIARIKGANSKKAALAQFYNPKKKTLVFDSAAEAKKYFGDTKNSRFYDSIKKGITFNNTNIRVKDGNKKPSYKVYKGRNVIATVDSLAKVSEIVGVHRTTVRRMIDANKPIGILNYRVKEVK